MTRELVLDCSVTASWVLPDERSDQAEFLLRRILEREHVMVVPELWGYEMSNVLRSATRRGRMSQTGAKCALTTLHEIPMERVTMGPLLEAAILDRALEYGLSAYDASYVVLAQLRGATLCTADSDILALRNRVDCILSFPQDICIG